MLSYWACCQPSHVFYWVILFNWVCRPAGHVVHQGTLSTGTLWDYTRSFKASGDHTGSDRSKGVYLVCNPLMHVFHQGSSSTGAWHPPWHFIYLGMWSSRECHQPGHVINRICFSLGHIIHKDMSSSGACLPLEHFGHRGMLFTETCCPPENIPTGLCCPLEQSNWVCCPVRHVVHRCLSSNEAGHPKGHNVE